MSARYRIRATDSVAGIIRGLHPDLKRKVRTALDDLVHDPYSGKALRLELAGLWSWRVGRLRTVYRIGASRIIDLAAVGPREIVYADTYRLMRKSPHRAGGTGEK